MQKLASAIINKRKAIIVIVLALTVVCACLIPFVSINSDTTKYLPDSSSMKQGVDIMEEEFPDQASQFIRVMFEDMPESVEESTADALGEIEDVERVDWESASEDEAGEYHQDNKTLFTLYTKADYETKEELAIEHTLETDFNNYNMVYKSGNTTTDTIPIEVIIAAVTLIIAVLVLMCGSFVEPLLILITVGCAVALNLGSNIIQGEISSITFSIAAILQLALSIDYSVILLNRYRAELAADAKAAGEAGTGAGTLAAADVQAASKAGADASALVTSTGARANAAAKTSAAHIKQAHVEAMKRALASTFSAVASSGITTVVGLLALVFMSFKIGADIGIVLGKGIAITLFCALTLLPAITLAADKLIAKTKKPVPHFAMNWAGAITSKGKYVFTAAFLALCVGSYIAQGNTSLAYVLEDEDPISEVFDAQNTAVVIYSNSDEDAISGIDAEFEGSSSVKSITSYANTIGKPYKVSEFSKEIENQAEGFDTSSFNEDTLRMMFYDKYDGTLYNLSAQTFLQFISSDVLENDTFASQISDENRKDMESLEKFSSAENLTQERNAQDLANFLGLNESDVAQILLAYGIEYDCYETGSLSLSTFINFINNEVANDATYGQSISSSQKSQLSQVSAFLDTSATTTPISASAAASFLGIDENTMQFIYMSYFAAQGACAQDSMTIEEFATFLQTDVAQNPNFSAYAGSIDAQQLAQLIAYAQASGMTGALDAVNMAQFLQMDANSVAYLYAYHNLLYGDTSNWNISIQDLLHYMLGDESISSSLDASQKSQLTSVSSLADAAIAGTNYSASEMANLLGMDASNTKQVYLLYTYMHGDTSNWTASVQTLLAYLCDSLLNNSTYSSLISSENSSQLQAARKLCDAVVGGEEYSASSMAELLSEISSASGKDTMLSTGETELLYMFWASKNYSQDSWTMSFDEFATYLYDDVLNDERFANWIDNSRRTDIEDMKAQIDDAKAQLVGKNYSILQFNINAADGSQESNAALDELDAWLANTTSGEYHLIGSSSMAWEMSKTFNDELLYITLLTAISIFIVVALTFRNLLVSFILVLLVECGVWVTVTVIGLQGYSIYYLALVVVQCILMGATIDYGILFTTNYREQRQTKPIKEALTGAYSASINTVLTSGTILVLVCAIVGQMFENPTIGQICNTISIGAFCTIVLIVIFLPGLLSTLDKGTAGKNRLR